MITSLLIGAITYGVSFMMLQSGFGFNSWEYWSAVLAVIASYIVGFIDNR